MNSDSGVYAYIGDTTSELSRTTRYSLLDASGHIFWFSKYKAF